MIIACADRNPTRIVAWAQRNLRGEPCFLAIDDGVRRTVQQFDRIVPAFLAGDLIETVGPGQARLRLDGTVVPRSDVTMRGSLPTLPEWARSLILWGRKAIQRGVTEEPSGDLPGRVKVVPCPVIGDARIERWTASLARRSAHTLDAIADILGAAVAECFNAWRWKPEGLVLTFHASDRAMGLAYSPGKGDRRISISTRMLEAYDADSIYRTVLHELCHHAREELHPRSLDSRSRDLVALMGHDSIFCRMLAEVDPTVRDKPANCRFFNDDADPQALAASEQKRGVVYTAAAGWLEIGVSPQYHMRYRWMPLKNGPHRWTSRWEPLTPESLGLLLDRFLPAERRAIVAEWSFDRGGKEKRVGNLESFAASAEGHFHRAEKLKEILA